MLLTFTLSLIEGDVLSNQRYCVCGEKIAGRRYLCDECKRIYGATRAEWPEWLVFLLNDKKREEMAERNLNKREICFTDMAMDSTNDIEDFIWANQ